MAETGSPSDIQSPLVGKQTPLSIYKLINAKPKEVVLRLRGESPPVERVVMLEIMMVVPKKVEMFPESTLGSVHVYLSWWALINRMVICAGALKVNASFGENLPGITMR